MGTVRGLASLFGLCLSSVFVQWSPSARAFALSVGVWALRPRLTPRGAGEGGLTSERGLVCSGWVGWDRRSCMGWVGQGLIYGWGGVSPLGGVGLTSECGRVPVLAGRGGVHTHVWVGWGRVSSMGGVGCHPWAGWVSPLSVGVSLLRLGGAGSTLMYGLTLRGAPRPPLVSSAPWSHRIRCTANSHVSDTCSANQVFYTHTRTHTRTHTHTHTHGVFRCGTCSKLTRLGHLQSESDASHTHTLTITQTRDHTHTHTNARPQTHTHTHKRALTNTYTHTHTNVHSQTHTHTPGFAQNSHVSKTCSCSSNNSSSNNNNNSSSSSSPHVNFSTHLGGGVLGVLLQQIQNVLGANSAQRLSWKTSHLRHCIN